MFSIGDKIVYPMHGAGIITGIEEKKILGATHEYYILSMPCGDMKIMVPVGNCHDVGIRHISGAGIVGQVLEVLKGQSTEMPSNWNRRCRENMEKLKSGDIFEVAEVVRNLMRQDREKKLSTGEKKLLTNAKQILISEMILASGEDKEQMIELVNEAV